MSEPHSGPVAEPGSSGLRLGQVFYGSLSGERNFRILADSGGLSRDEQDVVRHYSNLGGSAQTAGDPAPVWTAYPLARRRRAFSRTVFLGAGGRGNDYLAHILVLDAEALSWLRGDLFVLAGLDLFAAEKPIEDSPLPPLALDRDRLDRASARPVGADARYPLAEMADLLRALAEGPVALTAGQRDAGTDLCRTALSILPPDDRRLSFCSRFSHPRRAAFHLAIHQPEDAGLVEDGLVGFDRRRNELAPAPGGTGPFGRWLERAGSETDPLEPLTGLSLLNRPQEAVETVAALDAWRAVEPTGTDTSDNPLLAFRDAARRGDPIVRQAQHQGLPLLEIARHPRNRRLPSTGRLLLAAAAHSLVKQVTAALAGDDPFAETVAACTAAAEGTRPVALLGLLLGLARATPSGAPSSSPNAAAYAAAVCALTVGGSGGARAIYSRLGEDALWRSPAEAGRDLAALAAASPRAFLGLTTAWFRQWRELVGSRTALDEIGPLLGRLAEAGDSAPTTAAAATSTSAITLALRALEEAAPVDPGERRAWVLALIRRLSADLGTAFPTLTAARLTVEEGLLGELSDAELEELTAPIVESFPDRLIAQLEQGDLPWPLLRRAVLVTTSGLLSRRLGGRGWDLGDRPLRWELAARLAYTGAAAAAESGDRDLLAEIAWLVWAATRLVPDVPGDPLAEGDTLDRFADALDHLIEAGSRDRAGTAEADVALRALWRLRQLRRYEPRASAAALAALRDAALAASPLPVERNTAGDGDTVGDTAGSFAAMTRARIAQLEGQGLFAATLEAAP